MSTAKIAHFFLCHQHGCYAQLQVPAATVADAERRAVAHAWLRVGADWYCPDHGDFAPEPNPATPAEVAAGEAHRRLTVAWLQLLADEAAAGRLAISVDCATGTIRYLPATAQER